MVTQLFMPQLDDYECVCLPIAEPRSLYEAFASLNRMTKTGGILQYELSQEFFQALTMLTLTLRKKDLQLYMHSCRVQYITRWLVQTLALPHAESVTIELAGLLHDIGKVAIHSDVLQKPMSLTREEFRDVQAHAAEGARILSRIKLLDQVIPIVHHHHERWDGQGYPCGLQGNAIPFGARIVAIADAFEVMTSDRSYQVTRTLAQALEELRRCAGTQFDPVLVDRFCTSLETDFS